MPFRGWPEALRSSSCWIKGENRGSGRVGMASWRVVAWSDGSSVLIRRCALDSSWADGCVSMSGIEVRWNI